MDFIDQIKQFSKKAESIKDNLLTEEATKMSLVVPFFSMLGYDVFNPEEFVPEYTADVGIKKGEKVDYAIVQDGQPIILIEAKWCGENLDKHGSQLFRYFGTTSAKFAVLTNGLVYRFFTDLDSPNMMDEKPFLEIDILNPKEAKITELKKFHKSNFNLDEIFNTATELKYSNEFKYRISSELQNPTDEFTRLFLGQTYSGNLTRSVIEKFKPILKKALNNYINELMNDKIKAALNTDEETGQTEEISTEKTESNAVDSVQGKKTKIITTDEELEAYFIIKNLLKDIVPMSDIIYRDTAIHINILYKDNKHWICRLILKENRKELILPNADKSRDRFTLNNIYELENYKDRFIEILNRYI